MGKKKAKFTQEFKLEAVRVVTEEGYTQIKASQSLGIGAKNLSRWIKETIQVQKPASKYSPLVRDGQSELVHLRKEVKHRLNRNKQHAWPTL